MATIPFSKQDNLVGNDLVTWTPLSITDTVGQEVGTVGSGDRTVQVDGTIGAGFGLVIEGSLDGVNYYTLKDPSSTSLAFTGTGLRAILENVNWVRPRITNGDGSTAITVTLAVRKTRNG